MWGGLVTKGNLGLHPQEKWEMSLEAVIKTCIY